MFHAPWLLLGLAVLLIPLVIHLLNRRHYDAVDWAAMQFLKVSQSTRRRLLLEELLLMLARMGLLAAFVLALAGPFLDMPVPPSLAGRPGRDVVLVIDGSASMGAAAEGGTSPATKAAEWAARFLDDMQPGDTVALLLARERAVELTGALSADAQRAHKRLAELHAPAGTCNWAESLRAAFALLSAGQNRQREVVLLSDNQRFGVADAESLFRWELLASELGLKSLDASTKVRFVDLSRGRASTLPNYALAPLECNRPVAVVGREVRFKGALVLSGQRDYLPPARLRLEVSGKHVIDLVPPANGPARGSVPFEFKHSFAQAGSHLVSVTLEPPKASPPRDCVPGDNRQDFSVEVLPALPVLLVDGQPSRAPAPEQGTYFLRKALGLGGGASSPFRPSVVNAADFAPGLLTAASAPRVVVLHDVARLRPDQNQALAAYVASGGGVLVSPGGRCEAEWYNSQAYREGNGWLPARMLGVEAQEAKPNPSRLHHPALEYFRRFPDVGLADARFSRWWRLAVGSKEAASAQLEFPSGQAPFLVERGFKAGRVVLSAVPLDASFGPDLPRQPAFVPLVHELVYYLAGARSAEFNLSPGQPIRFPLAQDSEPADYSLATPGGDPLPLSTEPGRPGTVHQAEQPGGAMLVFHGARESGTYTLHAPGGGKAYFVVPADPHEADLTPLTDADREKVRELTGISFGTEGAEEWAEDADEVLFRQDLWLYFLLGVIALLCVEVWMTRRLAMRQ